jgi:hypothetical protein
MRLSMRSPGHSVRSNTYSASSRTHDWRGFGIARGGRRFTSTTRTALGGAILLGVLLTLSVSTSLTTSLAVVASFRYFEIIVWYLKLLFDSTHKLILSAERNLLFLVIDGMASITIVGLWLDAASRHPGTEPAWSAALTVFTLNGAPEQYDGWQSTAGTVLGTAAGLLLIVAGLAVLIELVGRRFQYGPAEDYTGPQRLPPPWRK